MTKTPTRWVFHDVAVLVLVAFLVTLPILTLLYIWIDT